MDNLFEILLPLIFFGLYFLSMIFGGKKKGGEDSPQEEPVSDEMRNIREELRRKIQERKQENASPSQRREESGTPTPQATGHQGRVLRENQPATRMQERRPERNREAEPIARVNPMHDSAYWEKELEDKMQEVEQTRLRADSLREETLKRSEVGKTHGTKTYHTRSVGASTYSAFLRDSLRNPQNLRRSFILYEVFGTPVGARRDGEIRPSWDL